MAHGREFEVRLTLAPDKIEHLISHRLIRRSLRRRQVGRLVSTYFDTPDLKLQRHRFGLRVRRSDTDVTHTLKQSGTSFVDRGEWERRDDRQTPNIVWLRRTPLAPLLKDGEIAEALGPCFSVDLTRTTLPLDLKGARIEVAIDQGSIRSDALTLPLSELELEIKRGKSKAVFDLARVLTRDLPLTLSLASKAERGYGISNLTWGRPTEAVAPKLETGMTVAQAFEAIIQSCLHAFLKNIATIQDERDDEALHRSRIALRHLRAACDLFRPVLRRKRFARLRKELRWLFARLGHARDADVFQAEVFEPAAQGGEVFGADALAQVTSDQRRRAHRRLRKALASRRSRLLYLDLLAFSSDGIRRQKRQKRYRPFARTALEERRRKLVRRARGLDRQTSEQMHDVRKSAKSLRYDLRLVGDGPRLMRKKRARRLGNDLKTLQQALGEIHDQEAVRDHLRATVLAEAPTFAVTQAGQVNALIAAKHIASAPIECSERLRKARRAARRLENTSC